MSKTIIVHKLGEVAEVKSGFAFKKAVRDEAAGDTSVIQVKDVAPGRPIPWDHLASVEGSPLMSGNLLKRDMVIFSAKGAKNFAWHVDRNPYKTICTSLFHIVIPDVSRVDPAFLAWQINQFPAQAYLTQTSAGVTVRNIRITAFKELPLILPPMDIQRKTAHYAQAAYREKQLLLDLIVNKETEMRALAANILTGHS